MPPWGAKEARLGNNPFCIGAPKASGEPVILDMAMSQAAWGKILMYHREGRKAYLSVGGWIVMGSPLMILKRSLKANTSSLWVNIRAQGSPL